MKRAGTTGSATVPGEVATEPAGVPRRAILQSAAIATLGAAALANAPRARADTAGAADPMAGALGPATSPGRRSSVGVILGRGQLAWTVSYDGRVVLQPAALGLQLASGATLGPGAQLRRVSRRGNDTTWRPVYGRQASVPDRYEELRVELTDAATGIDFAVVARAYDEGVAVRYELSAPAGEEVVLSGESTSFGLPAGTAVLSARDEAPFILSTAGDIPSSGSSTSDTGPLSDNPVLADLGDGYAACICESARLHYPRMMLTATADSPTMLRTHLMQFAGRSGSGPAAATVTVQTPFSTPWRVVVLGARHAELIDHADLVTTLAPESRVADTTWIRPGKAMRVTSLTTAGGLACADFAEQHGLRYIEFDAGWYGPEGSSSSDPTKPIDALDLPQVISYAAGKGVGVILYVNRIALSDPASLFATYRDWGVAGLKLGFLLDGTQDQTDWLVSVAETAAANQLLVNMHDDLRPFGQERTYPNWINLEGVRGNEHFPTATHNVTLAFGRNVAGPMDYTICLAQSRDQTTDAHQMAMAAVFYQPLAWLYWYDQPSKYASGDWPQLPWFDAIPTTWDESRALAGEVGQYAVVARRNGSTWYLGAMTNEQSRIIDVPLAFLGSGTWQATIYADGNPPDTAHGTPVLVSQQHVTAKTTLLIRLAPAGGQAIVLTPA